MIRWMSVAVVVCGVAGCSTGTTDPPADGSPPETVPTVPSASTFAGVWRCVTPSLEFIRLTVSSTSSQIGVLAARLTFSGVAWEGSGRIEGDAFVSSMTVAGVSGATGVMVARSRDGATLSVQMRPAAGATTELSFVREH
jgi:hypothetical protein